MYISILKEGCCVADVNVDVSMPDDEDGDAEELVCTWLECVRIVTV